MISRLRGYFAAKSASSLADETLRFLWPVCIYRLGVSVSDFGIVTFVGACGLLIGILVFPLMQANAGLKRTLTVALGGSILIPIGLCCYFLFCQNMGTVPLLVIPCISILMLSMFESFSFCGSEVFITRTVDRQSAQVLHQQSFFSQNCGAVMGVLVAGYLFDQIGVTLLALMALFYSFEFFCVLRLCPESYVENGRPVVGLNRGAVEFFKERFLVEMTLLAAISRFLVMGAVPFLLFSLARDSLSSFKSSVVAVAYSVGTVLGAVLYRQTSARSFPFRLRLSSFATIVSGLALTFLLSAPVEWRSAVIVMFCSGFIMAGFTIDIRAARHMVVANSKMPVVVPLQALGVRLLYPLSGLFFASILKLDLAHELKLAVLLVCSMLAWIMASRLMKRFVFEQEKVLHGLSA